jgi:hypothetical protein
MSLLSAQCGIYYDMQVLTPGLDRESTSVTGGAKYDQGHPDLEKFNTPAISVLLPFSILELLLQYMY